MSRPKYFLLASIVFCSGVVAVVHYQQTSEKARMHEGVIRDRIRTEMKRKEKERALQAQQAVDVEAAFNNSDEKSKSSD